MPSRNEITRHFTYHRVNDVGLERMKLISAKVLELALIVADIVPEGDDQTIVLVHLEDARMRANKALALKFGAPLASE